MECVPRLGLAAGKLAHGFGYFVRPLADDSKIPPYLLPSIAMRSIDWKGLPLLILA